MFKSKLVKTLKLLNQKELENFGYYLNCPIYNKDGKLIELFNILSAYHPLYDEAKLLNKQLILSKVYPYKECKDSSLRVLMSRLTKVLEEFCMTVSLQKDRKLKERLKLSFLTSRKAELEELQKNIEQHEAQAWTSTNALYHQLGLIELYFSKAATTETVGLRSRDMPSIMNSIDVYCVYLKLRYSVLRLSNSTETTTVVVDEELLKEVRQLIDLLPIDEFPFIHLYEQAYLLLTTHQDSIAHFDNLFALFQKYRSTIAQEEGRQISILLINFFRRRLDKDVGNAANWERLFELYCTVIEGNYLDFKGLPLYFKDIVTVALHLKKIQWTQAFIKRYKDTLSEGVKDCILNTSLAELSFTRKKYASAKGYLSQNDTYPNDVLKMANRVLYIKLNFELKQYTPLRQEIDSLRIYLFRDKKLSDDRRVGLNNFVRFVNRLISVKSLGNLEKLRQTILDKEAVAEKFWLLEKIPIVEQALTKNKRKVKGKQITVSVVEDEDERIRREAAQVNV